MGEYFIYKVKDTLLRNHEDTTKSLPALMAIQIKVQLGQTLAPDIIINKGIKEDDLIIVDGVQSIHTGSLIDTSKKSDLAKKDSHTAGEGLNHKPSKAGNKKGQ